MKSTATRIVQTLQDHGFEAYFVGGCVRDMLLGETPKDIDIATNALPDQIEDIFENTYSIGKHFGVILIENNGFHFEIATFRSDSGYSDGRRPDYVTFSSAEHDALRRDFTINGILYDPLTDQYLDFVDGQRDLRRGLLKFIGAPERRIQEDFLRILRAVRFKNRFDLAYDHDTWRALKKHGSLLIDISAERIIDEMTKILTHPSRHKALDDLWHCGVLQKLIPELIQLSKTPQPSSHHREGDALTHTFLVLEKLPPDESPELYWAALFHDIGKAFTFHNEGNRIRFPDHKDVSAEKAQNFCRRMKFSRYSTQKVTWLVEHHHLFDNFQKMKLVTKFEYFEHPFFTDLLKLARADVLGSIPTDYTTQNTYLAQLDMIEENYAYARSEKILPSHYPELLNGNDIMQALDLPPGKQIKDLKKDVRHAQIEGVLKTKKEAIQFVKEKFHTS